MGPIEVHIHLSGDKLIVPEKKADPPSEADGLLVRLMNKDKLSDDELMELTAEVVDYVKRKKAAGEMSKVQRFLKEENRAMLSPDMRDLIADILK